MENPQHKNVGRRYLLGDLLETEQKQVEESFLLDPEYRERVMIAEDELIDDYLDDLLSDQERRKFQSYFLATPQQQQKVRIARSLKKYALGRPLLPVSPRDADVSPGGGLGRTGRWFNLRNPFILLPVAAALLIVISLGILRLNEFRRTRDLSEQAETRRSIIEQELASINSQAETGGKQVVTVVLPPLSVRGASSSRKLRSPGNGVLVELQLVMSGEQYPAYRALLKKADSSESFTINDLHIASTSAGKVVLLRIPSNLLTRGTYLMQLFGVGTTGGAELVGAYDFQVTDNP
ncbi:MAG TPA: hypothetical protein VMS31_15300 [Pyrinomonadaceae bacterium]|nr:hypothetical protein [Pyrinomonadaceae bacterium]